MIGNKSLHKVLATSAAILAIGAGWHLSGSEVIGKTLPHAAGLPLGTADACRSYAGVPAGWRQAPHAGEVLVKAGSVLLGSAEGYQDERTRVRQPYKSFWIDATEVT